MRPSSTTTTLAPVFPTAALAWGLTACCWAAAMAWGCLQEASGASVPRWWSLSLPHLDKLAHGGMHALLAWLLWRCAGLMAGANHSLRTGAWIVAGCAAYGLALEWAQWQFTLTRSAEVLDAVANTVGAGVGVTVGWWRARGRH